MSSFSQYSATPRAAVPRTVWMLGLVSLLMDISSEMVQTLLPFYLVTGLGASAIAVGFIEGLSVAIATTTKLFAGVVSDWTRNRKMLASSVMVSALFRNFCFPLPRRSIGLSLRRP